MVASTPHLRAPVHFPLVENISIIYNNIPIYQKNLLRAGDGILVRKNEENGGGEEGRRTTW
jgi:hypothetical protein